MKKFTNYKLIGLQNKGILVIEKNNWLYIDGDITGSKYFHISDIEKAISCKLMELKSLIVTKITLH